ncbi:MAG: NAD(P)H-hydrate dehydratase [Thaumarchaeota archaeon]|jgi:NAD(P)H-hydrate epimerase|nr:NAD(P)H-hydrate dehydratase [Candidatus Wolframiiraptor allenii]
MGMHRVVDENFVRESVRPRRADSHKGENGVVLVIGGSWMYHGAPFLAAMAAMRCGVDLAYIAVPEKIAAPIRALSPAVIVIPLTDMKLTRGAARRALKVLSKVDSIVIGPGLEAGSEPGIELVAREAIAAGKSLVLDAGALYPGILKHVAGGKVVLTPHAGEFKRVFGVEAPSRLEDKVKVVMEQAGKNKVTILLKGRVDVISDGVDVAVNETGTPAMTTGGTGDILSGIVAAFLAWGIEPFRAAASAAWINGKAGELAAERLGLHIIATDLLDEIPRVMRQFDMVVE